MRSLLCETVTGPDMAGLLAARDAADTRHGRPGLPVDMVELRLDGVSGLDVGRALSARRLPVVATCRPVWEGGRFDGSETERAAILARALDEGAEFVDLEWRALRGAHAETFARILERAPERIVLSSHDFDGVPADLRDRAQQMRGTGAGTVKVAVMPTRLSDTLPLIEIGRDGGAVVIGMGEAGVPSRLLAARYHSKWTYAGHAAAPGQMPAARMVEEFRYRQVGPATRLFGVVSTNAMHSLSPAMHNPAFEAAGLDAVYVPLRAADFDDFLSFAAALGIEGASVTIPFKRDALRAATSADDLTRRVGAANTIRRRRDGWDATNTDVEGFLAPLDAAFGGPLRGARAAVVGAGGSARAVVVALMSQGAHVSVHARRRDQAQELAASLGAAAGAWPVAPGTWDLLVNCTPLGGAGLRGQSPVAVESLTGTLVYDLTYGAGESRLLQDARAAGCRTLDGLPMLIAQAERQFEWWTGQRPASGVMRDAVSRSRAAEPRNPGVS